MLNFKKYFLFFLLIIITSFAFSQERLLDSPWNRRVFNVLKQKYFNDKIYEQGIPLRDYIVNNFRNTNGFDPRETAIFVWPENHIQRERFLAEYDFRLFLENIDMSSIQNYDWKQELLGKFASREHLSASLEIAFFRMKLGMMYLSINGRWNSEEKTWIPQQELDEFIIQVLDNITQILKSNRFSVLYKYEQIIHYSKMAGYDSDSFDLLGL